jgi:hypothetical protein
MPGKRRAPYLALLLLLAPAPEARPQPPKDKPLDEKVKEIAGTAEFLRSVPKRFATLQAIDAAKRTVTLLTEGEDQPKTWPLTADAEVKVAGWWGRLDQFQTGDRVWVWFATDRRKQPVAVSMLADEPSEQDIHGFPLVVRAAETGRVTVKTLAGKARVLTTEGVEVVRGDRAVPPESLKAGEKLYVQSAGGRARLILDATALERRRAAQRAALRQRWMADGLPGTAAFIHVFSGEMDFLLDHEAMRWGRSLKAGDKVKLVADPPIPAVVKDVRPWRERTQVRLVVRSLDLADLTPGQRLHLLMPAPPAEVEEGAFPPDLDRPRTKAERVEWFLASIYCTCKVAGDICTGDFYTLASCNPNGCGMPNATRQFITALIDQGKTDRQIFEELLEKHGPALLRPHLLP